MVSRQTDQQALDNATSLAGTTFRMSQRHPISVEEEVRIQRYARNHKQKQTGLFRAFDIKPPVRVDKPRASGHGHHRENWSVDKLLSEESDVFEEIPPIMSEAEKKLYNSLISDQEKSSQGTVTTNALKQHLVTRGLALGLKLGAKRRPIITYLAELLNDSDVDPLLYTEEVHALMLMENMNLKENEFHWRAGAHIKNPSPQLQNQFYDNISRHFEEINMTKETEAKDAPVELLGAPTDVFEGVSANEWLKRQVAFCFQKPASQGNVGARKRGLKRKANNNGYKGKGRGKGRGRRGRGRGRGRGKNRAPNTRSTNTGAPQSAAPSA